MTITVTQEDIDKGTKWDSGQCPLARAFKREGVGYFWWHIYGITFPMRKFIDAFDRGEDVAPRSFETEMV